MFYGEGFGREKAEAVLGEYSGYWGGGGGN